MSNSDKSSSTKNSITPKLDESSSPEEYFQKKDTSKDKCIISTTLTQNSSGDSCDSTMELNSTKSSQSERHTSSKFIPKLTLTKGSNNSSLSVPPGGRYIATNSTHTPPTYHPTDPQEEFYSLCFQKYQPLAFYSGVVDKVLAFGKAFDEGSPASREVVWKHLYSLMGLPTNPACDLGAPLSGFINQWLQADTVNLFLLEVLYIAFMCATGGRSDPGLHVTESISEKDADTSEDEITMYTPWGCNVPAVLCQLMLLQHWLSKFEKLSTAHKKAIWNTCKLIQVFNNYNEGSFKLTFQQWAANPLINLMNISIFFAAIGFLRECGVLKYDFCYPKTTHPVFEVNLELSNVVSQQHIQLSLITSDSPRSQTSQQRQEEPKKQRISEDVIPVPPIPQHELQERLQALVGLAPMHSSHAFFPQHNNTFPFPNAHHNNHSNSTLNNNTNTHFHNTNHPTYSHSSPTLNLLRVAEAAASSAPLPSHNQVVHPYRRNSKVDLTTLVTARRLSLSGPSTESPRPKLPEPHQHHMHGSGILDVQGSGSFNQKGQTRVVMNSMIFTMREAQPDCSDQEDSPREQQLTHNPSNPRKRRSVELREQTVKKMSIQSLIT